MRKSLLVLALFTLSALAPFAGSAAGAVKTVKSTVTIASGNGGEFTGKVSSPTKQCRANRKVTLFKKPYAGEGEADAAVGADRTDASGSWTIDGSFIAGIYYARVASVLVHVNGRPIRCAFDTTVAMRF